MASKKTPFVRDTLSRRVIWQGLAAMAVMPACGVESTGSAPVGAEPISDVTDAGEPPTPELPKPPIEQPRPPFRPSLIPPSAFFPVGLASGDPSPEGVVLKTLYIGTRTLKVMVWEDAGNNEGVPVLEQVVAPQDGGVAHMIATGLEPHTLYQWTWLELENGEPVGRCDVGNFKTAPSPQDAPILRFAAVSCTSNSRQKKSLERAAEQGPFDAFLVLGDATYNDGAKNLEAFRAKWRESMSSAGWKAMRSKAPVVATWDDHEFDNNFNPELFDASQLASAKQAFFEFTPSRADKTSRLWRKVSFGQTADVFVLDCRSERKPSTRTSGDPIYISKAQMQWLKEELLASTARFKVLMNSVPIADLPRTFDLFLNDRWEGYPQQRTEILEFIEQNALRGVLWVSGDFHLASVGRVALSGLGSTQTEILVGPGAQFGNPLELQLLKPQFSWASSESNTTLLELNPQTGVVTCQWIGQDKVLREQALAL